MWLKLRHNIIRPHFLLLTPVLSALIFLMICMLGKLNHLCVTLLMLKKHTYGHMSKNNTILSFGSGTTFRTSCCFIVNKTIWNMSIIKCTLFNVSKKRVNKSLKFTLVPKHWTLENIAKCKNNAKHWTLTKTFGPKHLMTIKTHKTCWPTGFIELSCKSTCKG